MTGPPQDRACRSRPEHRLARRRITRWAGSGRYRSYAPGRATPSGAEWAGPPRRRVLSQEPRPERYDLGGATTARPDVHGLLPVFVLDRYEGYDVLVQDCTRAELAAGRARRRSSTADLRDHVLLGGPSAQRARATRSRRTARSSSTRCAAGPSWGVGAGVAGGRRRDVRRLGAHPCRLAGCLRRRGGRPRGAARGRRRRVAAASAGDALAELLDEVAATRRPGNAEERLPDEGNAERLASFLPGDTPTVVYFGKLLYNKGVHVLLAALREVDARAVIVGFGEYRAALEGARPARGVRSLGHRPGCRARTSVVLDPGGFGARRARRAARRARAGLVARWSRRRAIRPGRDLALERRGRRPSSSAARPARRSSAALEHRPPATTVDWRGGRRVACVAVDLPGRRFGSVGCCWQRLNDEADRSR